MSSGLPSQQPPLQLVLLLLIGFGLSLGYAVSGTALLYALDGVVEAKHFFALYVGPFNHLITVGLITGLSLIVSKYKGLVPQAIEEAFAHSDLASTDYFRRKRKYNSASRAIILPTESMVLGFVVLSFCGFPLSGLAETLIMLSGCMQWALAAYVINKLFHASMLVQPLLTLPANRDLLNHRSLDSIDHAVNAVSTGAAGFVYVYSQSHYNGPFTYDAFPGIGAQVFLLLFAIVAISVILIFNFFPRHVLRTVYDKSINMELENIRARLIGERMDPNDMRLHLMEIGKIYRDELGQRLRGFNLSLSDLPIGLTLLLMVAEPLILR